MEKSSSIKKYKVSNKIKKKEEINSKNKNFIMNSIRCLNEFSKIDISFKKFKKQMNTAL